MNLLDLIPGKGYLYLAGLGLAASAVLGGVAYVHHEESKRYDAGLTAGRSEVQAKWDAESLRQSQDALKVSQDRAKESFRRVEVQQENQDARDKELAAARADAATARRAADSVRAWADERVAAAGRRGVGDPGASCDCAAAESSARMLADVLKQSDERSGVLAAYGDEARIAGQQCERDYDALTKRSAGPSVSPSVP
jgi:hypothetical protein